MSKLDEKVAEILRRCADECRERARLADDASDGFEPNKAHAFAEANAALFIEQALSSSPAAEPVAAPERTPTMSETKVTATSQFISLVEVSRELHSIASRIANIGAIGVIASKNAAPPAPPPATELVEALEPFEDLAGEGSEDFPDDEPVMIHYGRTTHHSLNLGDLRRLRAALAKFKEQSHG